MKKMLIISIILNVLFLISVVYFINRKGGIRFIKKKLGFGLAGHDNGYGPYYDQRKSLFELLPRDSTDIIFLGHSLMDGCEWAELFDNPKMKNRGINGELSEGIIKRLDVIMNPPPAKLFVMTGANDIASNISMDEILKNCRVIMDSLKLHCPNTDVYFMSVLPISREYNQKARPIIEAYNKDLEKLAQTYHYTYIDLYDLVKDSENYFDECLSNDGSHLMGKGYVKVKEEIKKYVN